MKNNMVKKLLTLALAGAMTLSLAACGSKSDDSSNDAQQGGDLNAAASAGIGDRDALDVLDDIAAAGQLQGIRLPAQDLAGQSARIGDGDGLGTAHGGDQFPPQQLAVYGIYLFL